MAPMSHKQALKVNQESSDLLKYDNMIYTKKIL